MENTNILRKPVTLLTGYLGSGKTTVMNELLKNQKGKKLAVIVNDVGSVNIDASLIKKSGVSSEDTDVVELQNGCICCGLQDEFMTAIERIAKMDEIEGVLVEASGVSSADSVAQSFVMYEESHPKARVYLNSVVTVVDADRIYAEFLEDLEEHIAEEDHDHDHHECDHDHDAHDDHDEEESDPDIINLIIDQIEFCNMILLNKCDLISREKLDQVKKVLHELQPEAEIIETIQGKVDADIILNRERFNYDQVKESSLVAKTLAGEAHDHGHHHDHDHHGCCCHHDHDHHHHDHDGVYGITSFVYENRKPFIYDKFMTFLEDNYPEQLIRAKGYIWFEDDPIHVQLFEQAGRNASVTEMSNWVAALPEQEQNEVFENYPDVRADWDETYGDRMNQIVFIGKKYDKEAILKQLEACIAK